MKHRFAGYTWDHSVIPFMRWRCRNCGLKVPYAAAQQLEGVPCR